MLLSVETSGFSTCFPKGVFLYVIPNFVNVAKVTYFGVKKGKNV